MSDPAGTTPAMDEVAVTLNERLRPLKVSEYVALAELDGFENERVELLRGRVVRMAPQGEKPAGRLRGRSGPWAARKRVGMNASAERPTGTISNGASRNHTGRIGFRPVWSRRVRIVRC